MRAKKLIPAAWGGLIFATSRERQTPNFYAFVPVADQFSRSRKRVIKIHGVDGCYKSLTPLP